MNKPFELRVFGKPGCDKCAILNQRLDKILAQEARQDFAKKYCNLETEEGLVDFAEAECVNPQRIPALLVTRWNEDAKDYEPVPARGDVPQGDVCGSSRLCTFLGLQTDYSGTGRGVISPRMIDSILSEAVA